nr:transmembrane protein 132E [Anolis sagrei ordinatus]
MALQQRLLLSRAISIAFLCCCLGASTSHAQAKVSPTGPEPTEDSPPEAVAILPVTFRLSNARLAFFLRPTTPPPPPGNTSHSEPFVVFQTKELPVLNASLGPFVVGQAVPRELLQPSSTLEVPDRVTVNWKVRAFIVRTRVPADEPAAQVFFYVAGRDWDDIEAPREQLPCVRLHAFREALELRAACRLRGALAACLAQAELPQAWFGAPSGAKPDFQAVELYYTLHAGGDCEGEAAGRWRGPSGARAEGPTQHPLLRIGSLRLVQPPPSPPFQEQRLDDHLFLRLPDGPLRPGEVLRVALLRAGNSSVEQFTLRVKAKKGVNLLATRTRHPNWLLNAEIQAGSKHATSSVDVSWIGAHSREEEGPYEVMQLDFEMENFTSQSVTRRIMWHVDYRGRSPPPNLEKAMTELTVLQKDIRAILPLAMDTEIINTAILTGRTVAIPVKVIAIEVTGVILDISGSVRCKSGNEDIIKVSNGCDYVFVSGKETGGSMNAGVSFGYEHLSAVLEVTVWVPRIPLRIELSDPHLSQVKGWRIPIMADRRSVRESEDDEEEEEERRQSRGCALQFQRTSLRVFTQFHTTSSEGSDQVVTMLGPEWLVEVTDLVGDFMRVDDPQVARLVDARTLAGREPGTTLFKVVSPLTDAVLGEAAVTVAEEKVSLTALKAQLVSNLSLSLQPSPGSSHTIVAKASAQQALSLPKQEALLSLWVSYSDGTTAPLSLYDSRDYTLALSSQDPSVVSVVTGGAFPLLRAEGEGSGALVKAELTICEACQKTKRKSTLATTMVGVQVHFPSEEEPTYDYEPVQTPKERGTPGGSDSHTTTRLDVSWRLVPPSPETRLPSAVLPTKDFPTLPTGYVQVPRGLTDLEIGMYALLGVFCLAILVFLINCIVFVLKYRHKRIPPEGQTNMDHSHHWVFLGNGQPLRAQAELATPPADPLEGVPSCCHGDHHSSGGSSQTSVQSQVHGRGDGSSGGSTRDQSEDPLHSPTSKRKRVKFTTFATMPSEEMGYDSVPVADEEDLEWVCQDVGLQDPEELHNYIHRIKEMA